jgi:peptidoglycan/xylan/chitin deacetylase (PgdA/CDA1 family)
MTAVEANAVKEPRASRARRSAESPALGALVILLSLSACSEEASGGGDTSGGASGMSGATSVTGGSTNTGGTAGSSTGGSGASPTGGVAGAGAVGGGGNATGGSATGGSGVTGGSGATGGSDGGSAGSGAGGASAGSSSGGVGGASAGSSSGGSPPLGGTGGSATGGTGGMPNPGKSGLPVPPGASNVPKPTGTPANVTVVNWAGFKGAVSYTFDDSNSSQINNYAQLNALGVKFTFFLWTGKSDSRNSIWQTALRDGHELANHTQSHSSNGTTQDIEAATTFIQQQFGVRPWTLAAPNGAAVYTTLARGLFFINRGVGNAVIAPNGNSDPFTLPTYIPPTGANAAAFNTQVDQARTAGGWRTMCIHGFTGGSDGAYQPVPLAEFITSVEHAKSFGDLWLDTLVNVGAYWLGQKAFSQATTSTQGSDKTYTWTLPEDFPTGHYLRVKVDGGNLKQSGATLAWDAHGYYEIALDAGSVTLSP